MGTPIMHLFPLAEPVPHPLCRCDPRAPGAELCQAYDWPAGRPGHAFLWVRIVAPWMLAQGCPIFQFWLPHLPVFQ